MGKLLSDTLMAKQFDLAGNNLLQSTKNLKDITQKINQGEGIFGQVFTDTSFLNNIGLATKNLNYTTRNAKIISDNLTEFTKQMKTGKGAINKLLTDSSFANKLDTTLQHIDQSAIELDKAAETVRKNWFIRTFSSGDNKEKEAESDKKKEPDKKQTE
jgi:phospholipid/cholesterol/gamma-HCH transport system substrate-binding protein